MKFCIAAKADDHDKGEKRRMMRGAHGKSVSLRAARGV